MKYKIKKYVDRDGSIVEEVERVGTQTQSTTTSSPAFNTQSVQWETKSGVLSTLKVKCTGEHKPTRGSDGAAGIDLYNNGSQVIVGKGLSTPVYTKTYVAIPKGYVGLLFMRSGIGTKRLITLSNGTGIIDEDYRGEILAMVQYNGPQKYATIEAGERFAQLVIVPYARLNLEFVEELDATDRGEGGFGSTGTK